MGAISSRFGQGRTSLVACLVAAAFALFAGCDEGQEDAPPRNTASPHQGPSASGREQPPERRESGGRPERPAHFVDAAPEAGIDFRRYDDIGELHRIIESNGGGVALFDYDADGLLDVFFTNGCRLPRRLQDRSHPNRLYRNLGGSLFTEVTEPAGLLEYGYFHGCATGDYNGDGFDDLYVTAFGRNSLWRNNGDGTFSETTSRTETEVETWSSSAAFADLNDDTHLDIYVVNYVQTGDDPPRLCYSEDSPHGVITCPPTIFVAEPDVLFVSDGEGGFADLTQEAGVTAPDGKGLGVVVLDADRDGRPDIYVANDGTPNFLYMNRTSDRGDALPAPPRFEEFATLLGAAVNDMGLSESGMGIASGDYDADGWTDLFVTHFYLQTNTLYRNLGGRGFVDYTNASGLGPPSRLLLGFGTEFFDYDNDGWLDLFVANGHVDDLRWMPGSPPYRMAPQMFANQRNGRMADVSSSSGPYFERPWLGRGVAAGDWDNDGDPDLAVSHQLDPSALLRNDTATPFASVVVRLIGTDSNRSAIGARVEAEGLDLLVAREVIGGGSYQSASDRRVHIGLGEHDALPLLRVRWPSGNVEEWSNVAAGSYVAVEGARLLPMSNIDR